MPHVCLEVGTTKPPQQYLWHWLAKNNPLSLSVSHICSLPPRLGQPYLLLTESFSTGPLWHCLPFASCLYYLFNYIFSSTPTCPSTDWLFYHQYYWASIKLKSFILTLQYIWSLSLSVCITVMQARSYVHINTIYKLISSNQALGNEVTVLRVNFETYN